MENPNYPIEFIKRTIRMFQKNSHHFEKEDLEVTFLMNCLLGLIVTVSDNEERNLKVFKRNIDDDFLTLIPKKIRFVNRKNPVEVELDWFKMPKTELNTRVSHWGDLKSQPKFWLLNKIRNAITHQHIKGVNKNKKWIGVQLWNEPKAKMKDFEVVFTIVQLRNFAIKISKKYSPEREVKKSDVDGSLMSGKAETLHFRLARTPIRYILYGLRRLIHI